MKILSKYNFVFATTQLLPVAVAIAYSSSGAALGRVPITDLTNSLMPAPQSNTGPVSNLQCGVNWSQALNTNTSKRFSGTGYDVQVAIDRSFDGIGSGLTLINTANNASINVLETRSGAGAAWQNSYIIYDSGQDQLIVFNQGAGNSIGTQWGYSNSFEDLTGFGWTPMWSDHIHPTFSKTGFSHVNPTSPCNHNGYQFDSARSGLTGTGIESPHGLVTHLTYSFDLKSSINQSWNFWTAEQAFYLNRAIAGSNNLRVYLRGQSGWLEGPLTPAQAFSVQHTVNGQPSTCNSNGCSSEIAGDLAYAVFIWNVGGSDIAVALKAHAGRGAAFNNSTNVYCGNGGQSCGSIDWHTWMRYDTNGAANYPNGDNRHLETEYYIGTPTQLADLGFTTTGNSFSAQAAFTSSNTNPSCIAINVAGSNDILWSPANMISGGTYSSNEFSSNVNDRNTYVVGWNGNANAVGSSRIRLYPRPGALAFPDVYHLYLTNTANNQWVDFGVFNEQPNEHGYVDLTLGFPVQTSGALISPYTLGTDNYGGHYLQMNDIQLCQ